MFALERPYQGPVVEHYGGKSFVEFAIKKQRGDRLRLADGQFLHGYDQFFACNPPYTPNNFSPIDAAWIGRVKEKAAQLLVLGQAGEAYAAIVSRYRTWAANAGKDGELTQIYADLSRR